MTLGNWISLAILAGNFTGGWFLGRRIHQLRYARQCARPPVNVKVHLHDGRVIPVDTVLSEQRVWKVIRPSYVTMDDIAGLSADELPGMSEISLEGHGQRWEGK